jgi:hypothetical protein
MSGRLPGTNNSERNNFIGAESPRRAFSRPALEASSEDVAAAPRRGDVEVLDRLLDDYHCVARRFANRDRLAGSPALV